MSITDMFLNECLNNHSSFYHGVAVGIVTDINDPENLGRLKVKILMRDTSEYETDFIRVVTPMCGKQWGMFFFPEVGDEVLVAFGGGDLARPYVLGGLFHSEYKPPREIKDGKNDIRIIKTRSGHELSFYDEKEKEKIELKTPKSFTISLDDEKEMIIAHDKEKKNIVEIDSKNGTVTVNAEKKIVIKSGNSFIEIDGSNNQIVMEAGQSLTLKSQQITMEAKGAVQIKASSNVNLKSDGPVNVKGAVVKLN